jgi:hypothetical protein
MELVATSAIPIVSMCVFQDRLIVATQEGVFERLEDGKFHEIEFVAANPVPS